MSPPFPENTKPLSLWDVGEKAEKDFGIPTGLLRGLGMEESSGFNHWDENGNIIQSGTGPRGALQFTRKTAREMGINRDNPVENVLGGAKYLKQNYEALKPHLDDDADAWMAAAIAHNRGLGAVQGMIKNRRFEPSGKDSGNGGDTRAYAARIANNWAKLRGGQPFTHAETPIPQEPTELAVGEVVPDQYVDASDIANGVKPPVLAGVDPSKLFGGNVNVAPTVNGKPMMRPEDVGAFTPADADLLKNEPPSTQEEVDADYQNFIAQNKLPDSKQSGELYNADLRKRREVFNGAMQKLDTGVNGLSDEIVIMNGSNKRIYQTITTRLLSLTPPRNSVRPTSYLPRISNTPIS